MENEGSETMHNLKLSMAAARINSKLTQQEVAEKLQVSKITIHNWESGKTVPNWEKVEQMETLFNLPVGTLTFKR